VGLVEPARAGATDIQFLERHDIGLGTRDHLGDPFRGEPSIAANCLVAVRCWDQVRWAIGAYAWRFDGLGRASEAGGAA
jgi:hypothetical protein